MNTTRKLRITAIVLAGAGLLAGSGGTTPVAYAAKWSNPTIVNTKVESSAAHLPRNCGNKLVLTLHKAGFRGDNLKEAWAIAMRESRGRNVGPGDPRFNGYDWGIFQLNEPTWGSKSWWKPKLILNSLYNARVAYKLSQGGKSWVAWGLDGKGRENARIYRNYGWSKSKVNAYIVRPYRYYYNRYPC